MNQVIYCGLKLNTEATYFRFTEGDVATIRYDKSTYTVEVTFPKGIRSKELGQMLNLDLINDMEVVATSGGKSIRINPVSVKLNGLELIKTMTDPHTIRIVTVDDYPSRIAQTYESTTIVINESDKSDTEFLQYIFSNLKYLKMKIPRGMNWSNYKVANFPKVTIYDSNLDLTSESTYVHKLRSGHNRYLIKAVDYEHQFLHDVSKILEDFGVQLTRINREETLDIPSYISYSINMTPTKYVHPRWGDVQESVLCHTIAFDFTLNTPDMILFFDFKNKYNNVDLLTNYASFKAKDKYGEEWNAAIKWGAITEEFNHMYGQDNNSNFAHQCNFRAELFFYEVYDVNYNYITEIQLELVNAGMWEDKDSKTKTN